MIRQDWSSLKKLLFFQMAAGGGAAIEATATGNPLTFVTDLARPLKSLLIPFTPQQEGSGDPSPQNIRSILPWNGLTVLGGGKNLFDEENADGYNRYISYEGETFSTWKTAGDSKSYVMKATPNTQYSVKAHNENLTIFRVGILLTDPSTISSNDFPLYRAYNTNEEKSFTFTTQDSECWLVLQYNKAIADSRTGRVQVEVGQTASAYEEYKHITETDIVFPSPVYGGEHEAVSGKLLNDYEGHVTTWGAIKGDRYQSGYRQGVITFENEIPVSGQSGSGGTNQKCNIAKYQWDDFNGTSHFYTAEQDGAYVARILLPDDTPDETEIVVIAKLKTPQEITLTPAQITALVGDNTIWSDADGSMTATYLKKG